MRKMFAFQDPNLHGITHLILDEVHERSLHTDFILTLLKNFLATTHVKIVLMSATLDAGLFTEYFKRAVGGSCEDFAHFHHHAPMPCSIAEAEIEGRTFPVDTFWLKDAKLFAESGGVGGHSYKSSNNTGHGLSHPAGMATSSSSAYTPPAENAHKHMGVLETNAEMKTFLADTYGIVEKDKEVVISPPADETRINYRLIAELVFAIVNGWWVSASSSGGGGGKNKGGGKHGGAAAPAPPGVLIFLPGAGEIEKCIQVIESYRHGSKAAVTVLALHGQLPSEQQRRVFQKAAAGTVKVVVSTNVAETSVTVPDITDVIDIGMLKETRFSPETNLQKLTTVYVSHANAKQRAGRAGRVQSGRCWRLYDEDFFENRLPKQSLCEMKRTPLEELVLFLALIQPWGKLEHGSAQGKQFAEPGAGGVVGSKNGTSRGKRGDDVSSGMSMYAIPMYLNSAPEPPPASAVLFAQKKLITLGAFKVIDGETNNRIHLTPLGFHLAHMPMDPHVGKLLLFASVLNCTEQALTIAACLSSRSPFLKLMDATHKGSSGKAKGKGFGGKHDYPHYKEASVSGKSTHHGSEQENAEVAKVKARREADLECNRFSDHLAVCEAFDQWAACGGYQKKREFCTTYRLSFQGMETIAQLRDSFRQHLITIGFVRKPGKAGIGQSDGEASSTRGNRSRAYVMANCALLAGLYPNVAQVQKDSVVVRKGQKKGGFRPKSTV